MGSIDEMSNMLGRLVATSEGMQKQMDQMDTKLDCINRQSIIANESVKSAHKRLDEHAEDHTKIKNAHQALKKTVTKHENLKWAGIGIFSFVSFALGLVGGFFRHIFTGS